MSKRKLEDSPEERLADSFERITMVLRGRNGAPNREVLVPLLRFPGFPDLNNDQNNVNNNRKKSKKSRKTMADIRKESRDPRNDDWSGGDPGSSLF